MALSAALVVSCAEHKDHKRGNPKAAKSPTSDQTAEPGEQASTGGSSASSLEGSDMSFALSLPKDWQTASDHDGGGGDARPKHPIVPDFGAGDKKGEEIVVECDKESDDAAGKAMFILKRRSKPDLEGVDIDPEKTTIAELIKKFREDDKDRDPRKLVELIRKLRQSKFRPVAKTVKDINCQDKMAVGIFGLKEGHEYKLKAHLYNKADRLRYKGTSEAFKLGDGDSIDLVMKKSKRHSVDVNVIFEDHEDDDKKDDGEDDGDKKDGDDGAEDDKEDGDDDGQGDHDHNDGDDDEQEAAKERKACNEKDRYYDRVEQNCTEATLIDDCSVENVTKLLEGESSQERFLDFYVEFKDKGWKVGQCFESDDTVVGTEFLKNFGDTLKVKAIKALK